MDLCCVVYLQPALGEIKFMLQQFLAFGFVSTKYQTQFKFKFKNCLQNRSETCIFVFVFFRYRSLQVYLNRWRIEWSVKNPVQIYIEKLRSAYGQTEFVIEVKV